jgi:hypothetical protein
MTVREGKRGQMNMVLDLRSAFPSRPTDPAKLSLDFSKHQDQHPAATGK